MSTDVKNSDKQDKISACLNFYLKRRGYQDDTMKDSKKKLKKFVCDKDELLMTSNILKNIGSVNNVALSSLTSDPQVILSQFKKFYEHVQNNNKNVETSELEGLLVPALLHAFVDLVGSGYRTSAFELLKQQSSLLPKKDLLKNLLSSDEKLIGSFISEIKSKKFKFSISEMALRTLIVYLKDQDNLYLLQLFNRYIDFTTLYEDGRPHSTPLQISTQTFEKPTTFPSNQSTLDSISNQSTFDSITNQSTIDSNQSLIDSLVKLSTKLEVSTPHLPSIHLTCFEHFNQGLSCCVLSPNESLIASGCEDSSIVISTIQPHRSSSSSPSSSSSSSSTSRAEEENVFKLNGHLKAISSLDFFQDSRWLVSGSYDKTVRLWDVETRRPVVMYRGHTYHVTGLTTCTIGPLFASCSYDQTIKLWSTDRIFPIRNFLGHMQSVNCIACHPNSNYLASGSSDTTVRLWNVQDGRSVRLLLGHQGRVDALAFSADGKYLASAGEDTTIKVWDLGTGAIFKNLTGHSDHVYSLAFSQQFNILASGSMDGNIHMWNLNENKLDNVSAHSSEPMASFPTNSSCVMNLKFGLKNILHAVTKNF